MTEESTAAVKRREVYFQTVTREFLSLRGAPYQISPREMTLISDWHDAGIPLLVVRDGLRAAYEEFRRRPRRGKRSMTLVFCDSRVRRGFAQHRDRQVGRRGIGEGGGARRREALRSVDEFLASLPESLNFVRPAFSEARRELAGGEPDEGRLEDLEGEIEALLLKNAPAGDRAAAEQTVQREFVPRDSEEKLRLTGLMLLKILRERFEIPHVSLFYY